MPRGAYHLWSPLPKLRSVRAHGDGEAIVRRASHGRYQMKASSEKLFFLYIYTAHTDEHRTPRGAAGLAAR